MEVAEQCWSEIERTFPNVTRQYIERKKIFMDIKLEKDSLFDPLGLKRLRESYMMEEETSPQERFAYVSKNFGSDKDHASRLYDYSSAYVIFFLLPFYLLGVQAWSTYFLFSALFA